MAFMVFHIKFKKIIIIKIFQKQSTKKLQLTGRVALPANLTPLRMGKPLSRGVKVFVFEICNVNLGVLICVLGSVLGIERALLPVKSDSNPGLRGSKSGLTQFPV